MTIWFTGDTHFTHRKLMEIYPARAGFKDEQDMSEKMILNWNERIAHDDLVYHLGDFELRGDAERISKRLNGLKILVPGNHDRKALKDARFRDSWEFIFPYSYGEITIDGQLIILSHFPIWEWHQIHRGSWHLHGHLHGRPTGVPGKILDVGADGNNLMPYTFDDVRRFMDTRPVRPHHS